MASDASQHLPCPTCGTPVSFRADVCPRCGMPAASVRGGGSEVGSESRAALTRRKANADLLFLLGLVVGGPAMTVGGHLRLGLFIVLAGAFASVLRRYGRLSLGGAVGVGAAVAGLLAVVVIDAGPSPAADDSQEHARAGYMSELAGDYGPDGWVEARGPGLVTAWFFLPDVGAHDCSTVPDQEVRRRLAELGFERIVVSDRSETGSVCSFEP